MSISTVASPKPTVPVVSKAQEQTPEQISDNASKVKSDRLRISVRQGEGSMSHSK